MTADVTYKDIDMGFDALWKSLSDGDGKRVEVGLHDEEQAFKGVIQEFGTETTDHIRPRPWLSIAADTSAGTTEREGAAALRAYGPQSSVDGVLDRVGGELAKHTKGVILAQQVGGPPLKDATVDRKGHALKLIDSGDMLESIGHQVRRRGEP